MRSTIAASAGSISRSPLVTFRRRSISFHFQEGRPELNLFSTACRIPVLPFVVLVRDIDALNEELDAAGARVFAGGLEPASVAKSLRLRKRDSQ